MIYFDEMELFFDYNSIEDVIDEAYKIPLVKLHRDLSPLIE